MSGMVEPSRFPRVLPAGTTPDGVTERRNQRRYWTGRITWSRLKLKTLPPCDDCLIHVHEAQRRGEVIPETRIPRARYRRKNERHQGFLETFIATHLCDTHKQEWLDWTPGQMGFPS